MTHYRSQIVVVVHEAAHWAVETAFALGATTPQAHEARVWAERTVRGIVATGGTLSVEDARALGRIGAHLATGDLTGAAESGAALASLSA